MSELLSPEELAGIREDARQTTEVDTCIIERIVDEGQLQPNGLIIPSPRATIYIGFCAIYPILSRRDRFDELGEGLTFTRQYRVDLPWTVDDVQIRDRLTMVTSEDLQLIGREFEVRDVVVETNIGLRRLTVHDFRE